MQSVNLWKVLRHIHVVRLEYLWLVNRNKQMTFYVWRSETETFNSQFIRTKKRHSNIQTSSVDCFKASRIDLHFILNSNFLETTFRRLIIIIIDTPLLDHWVADWYVGLPSSFYDIEVTVYIICTINGNI